MIYLWEKEQEREIDRERERSEWMEDGGSQIGWVWGWSGLVVGDGQISDVEQKGEEELRKKREKRGRWWGGVI